MQIPEGCQEQQSPIQSSRLHLSATPSMSSYTSQRTPSESDPTRDRVVGLGHQRFEPVIVHASGQLSSSSTARGSGLALTVQQLRGSLSTPSVKTSSHAPLGYRARFRSRQKGKEREDTTDNEVWAKAPSDRSTWSFSSPALRPSQLRAFDSQPSNSSSHPTARALVRSSQSTFTKGEKELKQRLLTVLQGQPDLLGRALAKLRALSQMPSTSEFISELLPTLKHPWEIPDDPIAWLGTTIQQIDQTLLRLNNSAAHKPLKTIVTFYTRLQKQLQTATSKERGELLAPKATICGDLFGPSLVDPKLLTHILKEKGTEQGTHQVIGWQGIHWKFDDREAGLRITPGREYAVGHLIRLFSGDKQVVTPTCWLRVRLPQIESCKGKEKQEALPAIQDRYIQASLSVGYQSQAISLHALLEAREGLRQLKEVAKLQHLAKKWAEWVEAIKQQPKTSVAQLIASCLQAGQQTPLCHCLQFQQGNKPYLPDLNPESQRQWFAELTRVGRPECWQVLIDKVLPAYPQLINNRSLFDLSYIVQALDCIPQFLPKVSPKQHVAQFPKVILNIDAKAFGSLVIGCLLGNVADAKSDNFMIAIEQEGMRIVGVDNDRSLFPPIHQEQEDKHGLRHLCILYAFPAWMNRPIHHDVAQILLAHEPREFVLKWLARLDHRNQIYHRLLAQGILHKKDLLSHKGDHKLGHTRLDLPIHLPVGILDKLCSDIEKLQRLLKSKGIEEKLQAQDRSTSLRGKDHHTKDIPTYNQLFALLRPIVHAYYQQLINPKQCSSPADLQRFLQGSIGAYQENMVEEVLQEQLDTVVNGQTLKERLASCSEKYQQAIKGEPLEKIGSAFLKSIQLEKLKEKEFELLTSLFDLWAQISFAPPPQLPSDTVQRLLRSATTKGQSDSIALAIQLQGRVDQPDTSGVTPLHLFARSCADWSPEQIRTVYHAICTQETIQWSLTDNEGRTSIGDFVTTLHSSQGAMRKVAKQILEDMAQQGVPLDKALEKAIELHDLEAFELLVQWGAGCHLVDGWAAVRFYHDHRDDPKVGRQIRETFATLQHRSPEAQLAENLLAMMTQSPTDEGARLQRVKGVQMGTAYWQEEVLAQLNELELWKKLPPQEERAKTEPQYGNHKTGLLSYHGATLFLKGQPEMPGFQYAVDLLIRLLIGYGVVATDLLNCSINGDPYAVLASTYVKAEKANFHEVLKNDPQWIQKLKQLDLRRLHNLMLALMLVDPEDGKPANFVLRRLQDGSYELVAVDSDHAFVDPVEERMVRRDRTLVKCIVWCLRQMVDKVHPDTRRLFLEADPHTLLHTWLTALCKQHTKANDLFPAEEREHLVGYEAQQSIPLNIPISGRCVKRIWERLTAIQSVLRADPQATVLDVLDYVLPQLGRSYGMALYAHLDNPLACFDALFRGEYGTGSSGQYTTKSTTADIYRSARITQKAIEGIGMAYSPQEGLEQLKAIQQRVLEIETTRGSLIQGDVKPLLSLQPPNRPDRIIAGIDFSTCRKQETQIVKALEHFANRFTPLHSLRWLRLQQCRIPNEQLRALLTASPKLLALDLIGCSKITQSVLQFSIFERCRHLRRIRLVDCPKIGGEIFRKLNLLKLRALHLERLPALRKAFLPLGNLARLNVINCATLKTIRPYDSYYSALPLASLKHLTVKGCHQLSLKSLTRVAGFARPLRTLQIKKCYTILKGPAGFLLQTYPLTIQLPLLVPDVRSQLQRGLSGQTSTIDLSRYPVRDGGAIALARILEADLPIESLNLQRCGIGLRGMKALGRALRKNTRLMTLRIAHNNVPNQEMVDVVSQLLRHNHSVTRLDVRDMELGVDDTIQLLGALYENTGIAVVDWIHTLSGDTVNLIVEKLTRHTSLTDLNLSPAKEVTEPQLIRPLIEAFQRNTSLTRLNLKGLTLGDATICSIAKALTNCLMITDLDFSHNEVGNSGVAAVAALLHDRPTLTRLNLEENNAKDAGCMAIAEALRKNCTLNSLNLRNNLLTADSLFALCKPMQSHPGVEELFIYPQREDRDHGTSILQRHDVEKLLLKKNRVLKRSDKLKSLEELIDAVSSGLPLEHLGLVHLPRTLRIALSTQPGKVTQILEKNHSLTSLDLSTNSLSFEAIRNVCQALGHNSTITRLQLRNCWRIELGEVFSTMTNRKRLRYLDLTNTKLNSADMRKLCKMLKQNHPLKTLLLQSSLARPCKVALKVLEEALVHNTTLTQLDLRNNKVKGNCCAYIGSILNTNQSLRILDLSNNRINGSKLHWIAQGLQKNNTLRMLKLTKNSILPENMKCFLHGLRHNVAMQYLDLTLNGGEKERFFWSINFRQRRYHWPRVCQLAGQRSLWTEVGLPAMWQGGSRGKSNQSVSLSTMQMYSLLTPSVQVLGLVPTGVLSMAATSGWSIFHLFTLFVFMKEESIVGTDALEKLVAPFSWCAGDWDY